MAPEVQLLSIEGWLVELEVVLAKPEWLKHLTCPTRGPQKSSQLCFCLIPPPEPPALQSPSAGAGGWTPLGPSGRTIRAMAHAWTSRF